MHALPSSGFAAKLWIHLVQVYGSAEVQAGVQNEATVLNYEFKLKVRSTFFNLNFRENFSYASCSWLCWGLVEVHWLDRRCWTNSNVSHNQSWFHIRWNKNAILIGQWLILLSWILIWDWLGSKKFTEKLELLSHQSFHSCLSSKLLHGQSYVSKTSVVRDHYLAFQLI